MKLRGMSQDAIANRLNELGILSPFEYKISSGSHYKTGFRQKEQALWSSVTVRRILENEVYIGNLVQVIIPGLSEPPVRTLRAIYSGNSEPPYWALLHIFPLYCKDTPLV